MKPELAAQVLLLPGWAHAAEMSHLLGAEKAPMECISRCVTRILNKPGMPITTHWVKGAPAQPTAPDFVCSRYNFGVVHTWRLLNDTYIIAGIA